MAENRREINKRYYEKLKEERKEESEEKRSKKEKARYQYWSIIVYPESAPVGWKDRLDDLIVPWVCSPLHDKDVAVDKSTGEISQKKAHWHVILKTGKKSYRQVKEWSDLVCGAPPIGVLDPAASVRYLIHMDHPDKYQYDKSDIECHCGFDCRDWLGLNTVQQLELLDEMIKFCREHEISEFSEFYFWAQDNNKDWWEYMSLHVYQVYTVLRSWHHRINEENIKRDMKIGIKKD